MQSTNCAVLLDISYIQMLIPNGFTRLSTSPILLALLDLIFFPVSIISRASGSPTWRNHDNYQNKKNSIAIMFVLVPGLKISMSHSTTQFIWRDINQKSWQACTCWPLLWKSTTTCVQFFSFKMIANGIWSVRSCLNAGRTLLDMSKLRWLDTVFQGQYRPSLSINYVTINKVLEKLPPQLY